MQSNINSTFETHPLPYRIGLTGNIATGKSTVGKMLVELGALRIDADRVAHAVMMPDGAAYSSVLQTFGTDILSEDGLLDRKKLGTIVFTNPLALQRLESLVHPPVISAINQMIDNIRAQVVVVEAIKLLETGMADNYDTLWVTTCPESVQLSRLINLRKLQREDALRRLRAQPPQKVKLARADVVINTAGTLEETRVQVNEAWYRLPLDFCQDDRCGDQSAGT